MAEYVRLNWNSGETLTRDDLVTVANNQDWLYDNMTKMRHTNGGDRDVANKIVTGRISCAADKDTVAVGTVQLGNYFHSDCKPTAFVQLVSNTESQMFTPRTTSLTGTLDIGFDGFKITGNNYSSSSKKKNITSALYFDWVAFGWG